jgi:hypothetical protein
LRIQNEIGLDASNTDDNADVGDPGDILPAGIGTWKPPAIQQAK